MRKKLKKLLRKIRVPGEFKALTLIVFLISLWFYWFQYRPSRIRIICDVEAKENAIKVIFGPKWELTRERREFAEPFLVLKDDYKEFYEACLHAKGFK